MSVVTRWVIVNCSFVIGEPLTVDSLRSKYGELLKTYFGPDFAIDECLSLECFRIPHFYRAFYVYQYATGLSAAIALPETQIHTYLCYLEFGDIIRDRDVEATKKLRKGINAKQK